MDSRKTFLLLMLSGCYLLPVNAQKQLSLFSEQDSSDWYIYVSKRPTGEDPNKVFVFENNAWHVSGQDFGYIVTKKQYGDFHLTLEFKWGEKKYPPREHAKRDGGILYHVDFYSGDKIWPRSLEYQVQEGDCGDFWMTDSTTIIHNGDTTKRGGAVNAVKTANSERAIGEWNQAEVRVRNGAITHLLNGKVVNTGKLANTKKGNILLQSEGAEVFYRNVKIETFP